MSDKRVRSQGKSAQTSRLSNYSGQYFSFFDTNHSVFSRNSYYNDLRAKHPWSRRPRSRNSGILLETLRGRSCSPRVVDLAQPKIKHEQRIRQEYFDNIKNYAYSGVKPTALTAQCSGRVSTLAEPKIIPNDYADVYLGPKSVSTQDLHTSPSDRIDSLAKPRQNTVLLNTAWKNAQK